MSFGVSPSDVVKLVEFSTRIYIAFKDANDNSEAQVEGLVKEFSTFHLCLVELDDLMKEYGKPLPFPYLDFKETLVRCEKTIKPYANHLVDNKRMTGKKFIYTIKYIGKEKEIDGLRKQISGHYQALQMCISFLQLRLHLEATKQTQRLLDSGPFRAMSFGGQMYSSNAFASSARQVPNALPAPSEADQLYKDWLVFNRWLKNEDERIAQEAGVVRPLSLGASPAVTPSGGAETAAVLYHLRRELEDAILIEENRAKRVAAEMRTNLSPSDAIRQAVRHMPQIPQRTYTLDTEFSGLFSGFNNPSMADSAATIRPSPTESTTTSPFGSPSPGQSEFGAIDWGNPTPKNHRSASISTNGTNVTARTSFSTSPESRLSVSGISSAGTTPEDHPLQSKASSIHTLALGEGALEWNKLCKKVYVERETTRKESRECDVHWRYREDHGLSLRSVYRDERTNKVQVWITQNFPATGPSIPLTTTHPDGEVSIDFPRASFGRLEKRCTDIKYTLRDFDSSMRLQTLLYTNNGSDSAELLFDRPVLTISSDKHKPECRSKNLRLWRRTEIQDSRSGLSATDALIILFYTSALPEEKAHWVEEPHYAFQWLEDSVFKKSSEKLELIFSKEPDKWSRDKLFQSNSDRKTAAKAEQSTALATLEKTFSLPSRTSSIGSTKSSRSSIFDAPSKLSNLNRFGYSSLRIEFTSKKDRKEFLDIWKTYVKPLGYWDER